MARGAGRARSDMGGCLLLVVAQLVVVADPQKRVLFVHRPGASPEILGSSDTLAGDPAVPGWTLKVGDAFPEG